MAKQKIQSIKDRLLEYREREREIDNQIERIENLERRMTSLRSPELSGMPHAQNTESDRFGKMFAKKDEMERNVRELIDFQEREKSWIEGVLRHIKKADERACIQIRYIDGESWPKVTMLIFGREDDYNDKKENYIRQVTRLHGRALQKMAEYLETEGYFQPAE